MTASASSQMMSADNLILLSDVDGLYNRDPRLDKTKHIPIVHEVTPKIEAMAGVAITNYSSGAW